MGHFCKIYALLSSFQTSGLIDEGESAESTAFRELHEETGYIADKVIEISPVVVCDPGKSIGVIFHIFSSFPISGMTNANMQLVVLSVTLDDQLESPKPNLEAGEHIVTRVIEMSKLKEELQGKQFFLHS